MHGKRGHEDRNGKEKRAGGTIEVRKTENGDGREGKLDEERGTAVKERRRRVQEKIHEKRREKRRRREQEGQKNEGRTKGGVTRVSKGGRS